MSSRRALASIALTAAFALVPVSSAAACSCVPLSPETVRGADAAAIAQLVDVTPLADGRSGRYTYDVRRVLIGEGRLDRNRVRVVASLSSAACGPPQQKRRYGLVLTRMRHRWSASLCSITSPKALRALAAGERPNAAAQRRYCWGMPR